MQEIKKISKGSVNWSEIANEAFLGFILKQGDKIAAAWEVLDKIQKATNGAIDAHPGLEEHIKKFFMDRCQIPVSRDGLVDPE